jgi:hypothetical protein
MEKLEKDAVKHGIDLGSENDTIEPKKKSIFSILP